MIPERVERTACWLARQATRTAVVAAMAGLALWWAVRPDGAVVAAALLVVLLAPALWLLNVRFALVSFVALPETLGEIARRRGDQLRSRPVERPPGGVVESARTVRDLVRDYGEVTGSWGLVVQLATPTFWVLTGVAAATVPVLAIAAVVAAIS